MKTLKLIQQYPQVALAPAFGPYMFICGKQNTENCLLKCDRYCSQRCTASCYCNNDISNHVTESGFQIWRLGSFLNAIYMVIPEMYFGTRSEDTLYNDLLSWEDHSQTHLIQYIIGGWVILIFYLVIAGTVFLGCYKGLLKKLMSGRSVTWLLVCPCIDPQVLYMSESLGGKLKIYINMNYS